MGNSTSIDPPGDDTRITDFRPQPPASSSGIAPTVRTTENVQTPGQEDLSLANIVPVSPQSNGITHTPAPSRPQAPPRSMLARRPSRERTGGTVGKKGDGNRSDWVWENSHWTKVRHLGGRGGKLRASGRKGSSKEDNPAVTSVHFSPPPPLPSSSTCPHHYLPSLPVPQRLPMTAESQQREGS
jgi:hypothetical protein